MSRFEELVPLGTFVYTEEQRERWRSGSLAEEWHRAYPAIFDEHDLRLAGTQPDYHFFEWLAAIQIYNATGWPSLVEKYQEKRHTRKQEIFHTLFEDAWLEAISGYGMQLPDLLVYREDLSDFFLCEVKGRYDRLRPEQAEYFAHVRELTGKSIYYVQFNELKGV